MTDKLKNVLSDIHFKDRFDALFQKHSHRNLFKKADPLEVEKIIKNLGYDCKYYESNKFFKVDGIQSHISLNLSIDIGIVEFILDVLIDGEGDGGPFDYMCTLISTEENSKAPRFSNYEELKEILVDGLRLYEDIKSGLKGAINEL